MALLFRATCQTAVVAGSRQAESAVVPGTAPAYSNNWEIWSMCFGERLLLLAVLKALAT